MTTHELSRALRDKIPARMACDWDNDGIMCLPDPDRTVKTGYAGDLLSWVMGRAEPDCVWLTIMSNANVCAVAVLADVGNMEPERKSRCPLELEPEQVLALRCFLINQKED